MLGECKWRGDLNVAQTIATLRARADLGKGYADRHSALFLKTDELAAVAARRDEPDLMLVGATEMFAGAQ